MAQFYEVIFSADFVSKKNAYAQTKAGRRFKPQSVRDAEELCLSQIPAEMFHLNLKHPAIEFWAYIPKKNQALDIDGVFTTILDICVKAKILVDDNIRNCNGPKLLYPVQDAERKKAVIRFYPDGKIPGLLL